MENVTLWANFHLYLQFTMRTIAKKAAFISDAKLSTSQFSTQLNSNQLDSTRHDIGEPAWRLFSRLLARGLWMFWGAVCSSWRLGLCSAAVVARWGIQHQLMHSKRALSLPASPQPGAGIPFLGQVGSAAPVNSWCAKRQQLFKAFASFYNVSPGYSNKCHGVKLTAKLSGICA